MSIVHEQGAPALWKAVPRAMHETRSFDTLLSLSGNSINSMMAASLHAQLLHEYVMQKMLAGKSSLTFTMYTSE